MNQSKSKLLRKIFLSIAPFPAGDPRNKAMARRFKRDYQAVPRPQRSSYLESLQTKISLMMGEVHASSQSTQ